MTRQTWKDLGARAGWTALAAVLGVVSADQFGLPTRYVPLVAVLFTVLKSLAATRVGDSASVTFTAQTDRDARQTELFP